MHAQVRSILFVCPIRGWERSSMRQASAIFTMLLLSSVALTAQTASRGTNAILTAGPVSASCPVGFYASRTAAPTLMVTKGSSQTPPNLGLQLNFSHTDTLKIAKASITVHGASTKGRFMPADTAEATDMTETFSLQGADTAQKLRHAEVWLTKMNAVSWVDLTEIEYVDGSVWHASRFSKCRAVPSNLLLVR
jgi:hypothetical protein